MEWIEEREREKREEEKKQHNVSIDFEYFFLIELKQRFLKYITKIA